MLVRTTFSSDECVSPLKILSEKGMLGATGSEGRHGTRLDETDQPQSWQEISSACVWTRPCHELIVDRNGDRRF
jgi:hypothetical protein